MFVFDRDTWCLNEMHMFGVLFGGLLGLTESWNYYFSDRRLVKLPNIQQHVKVAVWSSILPLAKSVLATSARTYLGYMLLYFLFGGVVRSYVLGVTRLSLEDPLDTIVGVMSLGLAFRCILIGSATIFTIRLCNLLFQLFEIKVLISFKVLIKQKYILTTNLSIFSAHRIPCRSLCRR